MADITYREYWTEIESIAREVSLEAKREDREIHDVLHETIDSHQWVIYTHSNYDVAKLSPNDDAWTDLYGGGEVPDNFDAVRAYCAMERDVYEHSDFRDPDDIDWIDADAAAESFVKGLTPSERAAFDPADAECRALVKAYLAEDYDREHLDVDDDDVMGEIETLLEEDEEDNG